MRISCYRCGGSGWVCEKHTEKPQGHDSCAGTGIPCSRCNRFERAPETLPRVPAPHRRSPPRDVDSGKFTPRSPRLPKPFSDSFDYDTLWALLERIGARHRLVRFVDLAEGLPAEPFCILRHDVDYTLYAAIALARQEAARGIRATYFMLVNSPYYNLLSPSHAHVPRELVSLGHEVGLHYDVNVLEHFSREDWEDLLTAQAALLECLSGSKVSSIAMHQPGLNPHDSFRDNRRFLNAYADRFTKETTYISDSCRAWRDSAWQTLTHGPLPDRLQLSLHPINWSAEDRDRLTIFRALHLDLANAVLGEGEDLLSKIAVHPAVLEHNARTARS